LFSIGLEDFSGLYGVKTFMFDYDKLDEMDKLEQKVSGNNPLILKLIAMKMRHRAAGLAFKRQKQAHFSDSCSELSKPLNETSKPNTPSIRDSIASRASSARSVESGVPASATSRRSDKFGIEIEDVEGPDNLKGLRTIFLHPFCTLLMFVPLGVLSPYLQFGDTWTFWLNFMALVPLAKVLGDATEELAGSLRNDTLSGLLNATFGNAVEMIISVQTLRAGLLSVVKATLLGSILSNILLVLGTSLFLGGLTAPSTRSGRCHNVEEPAYDMRRAQTQAALEAHPQLKRRLTLDLTIEKEQTFPVKSAQVCMAMLLLSCMSIALPTIFDAFPSDGQESVLTVSRIGACITGSSYVAFLIFQLYTHKATLGKDENMGDDDDDEEEDGPGLTTSCAIGLMAVTTVVVAMTSEFLVDAINGIVKGSALSETFIGVILLPIAGNACEHAGAIRFAMQDRPGLAIGIAVGSSTQIALFVIPFAVIAGWYLDQPMNLNFGTMNTAVMILSVLVVLVLVNDGRSNWMKGYMMCACYAIIAVLYAYLPAPMGQADV